MRLEFRLAAPLKLPNRVGLGLNYHAAASARRLVRRELSREIWMLLGCRLPQSPMPRAAVTVRRHGIRAPDKDNLHASAKALLDVLQPYAANRKYGLGIIAGDDPQRLELDIQHVPAARLADQCTVVMIEEMAAA